MHIKLNPLLAFVLTPRRRQIYSGLQQGAEELPRETISPSSRKLISYRHRPRPRHTKQAKTILIHRNHFYVVFISLSSYYLWLNFEKVKHRKIEARRNFLFSEGGEHIEGWAQGAVNGKLPENCLAGNCSII